jgi:hypothetical protein
MARRTKRSRRNKNRGHKNSKSSEQNSKSSKLNIPATILKRHLPKDGMKWWRKTSHVCYAHGNFANNDIFGSIRRPRKRIVTDNKRKDWRIICQLQRLGVTIETRQVMNEFAKLFKDATEFVKAKQFEQSLGVDLNLRSLIREFKPQNRLGKGLKLTTLTSLMRTIVGARLKFLMDPERNNGVWRPPCPKVNPDTC